MTTILFLGIHPQEMKTYIHTKTLRECLKWLFHNKNLERTQLSINWWIDKQTVVHPYNGILFSKIKRTTDTCKNMDESQIC